MPVDYDGVRSVCNTLPVRCSKESTHAYSAFVYCVSRMGCQKSVFLGLDTYEVVIYNILR